MLGTLFGCAHGGLWLSVCSVARMKRADLVDEVLQIGTTHTGTTTRDDARVNIDIKLHFGHVMFQNLDPSANVGQSDNH